MSSWVIAQEPLPELTQETTQNFVESQEFKTLKTSIQNRDFVNAWQTAQSHADSYLGDADFDFLYGIAALENNHVEQAVFAFERVVSNKPAWLDAQYYLAKSYYYMKDYQSVIKLSDALNSQPELPKQLSSASKSLKETAQRRLAQQSLYYQQQLRADLGYDSNLNAGVDADNIFLPFLGANVALNDASKENSDSYASLYYQFNGSKALTQKSKLLFFTQANLHQFINETDYNRMTFEASLSYLQQFDLFDASVGVSLKPLWFSSEYYRSQGNINAGIKKRFNEQWSLSADLSLGQTQNAVNDYLDTDDAALSITGQYFIGNWRHSASISYLNQESQSVESEHNSSQSNAINFNSLWLLSQKWLMSTSLSWQRQTYSGIQPFYLTQRVDDFLMITAMMQFKPTKAWSYRLNANVQDRNSNLSLFSYQRIDVGLTASFDF